MSIPQKAIDELKVTGVGQPIPRPSKTYFVGKLSNSTMQVIKTDIKNVYISRMSLKHILEQRGNEEIILKIPQIISHPTKIIDNFQKRVNSFIFVKMNGKANGVVIELTKTPDENRVVSAFPINRRTYRKLKDISGRPDVPP